MLIGLYVGSSSVLYPFPGLNFTGESNKAMSPPLFSFKYILKMRSFVRFFLTMACLLHCTNARGANGITAGCDKVSQGLRTCSFLPKNTPHFSSDCSDCVTALLSLRGGGRNVLLSDSSMNKFFNVVDLFGTGLFAFSGAVTAAKTGMDIMGVLIVATITAVGGGTVRDVLLDSGTVFWMQTAVYLRICITTAVLTFFLWPKLEKQFGWKDSALPICTADALCIGAFSVIGTQKAISLGMKPPVQVACGLMTCCFGGIIRDVICMQPPRVLYPYRTLYATPPLLGSIMYALLTSQTGLSMAEAALSSILVTFLTRVLSFNSPRRLPCWQVTEGESNTGSKSVGRV